MRNEGKGTARVKCVAEKTMTHLPVGKLRLAALFDELNSIVGLIWCHNKGQFDDCYNIVLRRICIILLYWLNNRKTPGLINNIYYRVCFTARHSKRHQYVMLNLNWKVKFSFKVVQIIAAFFSMTFSLFLFRSLSFLHFRSLFRFSSLGLRIRFDSYGCWFVVQSALAGRHCSMVWLNFQFLGCPFFSLLLIKIVVVVVRHSGCWHTLCLSLSLIWLKTIEVTT